MDPRVYMFTKHKKAWLVQLSQDAGLDSSGTKMNLAERLGRYYDEQATKTWEIIVGKEVKKLNRQPLNKHGGTTNMEIQEGKNYTVKIKGKEVDVEVTEELDKGWLVQDSDGNEFKVVSDKRFIAEIEYEEDTPKEEGDVEEVFVDVGAKLDLIIDMVGELLGKKPNGKKKATQVVEEVTDETAAAVTEKKKQKAADKSPESDDAEINELLEELADAKANKDDSTARKIRATLRKKGYSLRKK